MTPETSMTILLWTGGVTIIAAGAAITSVALFIVWTVFVETADVASGIRTWLRIGRPERATILKHWARERRKMFAGLATIVDDGEEPSSEGDD